MLKIVVTVYKHVLNININMYVYIYIYTIYIHIFISNYISLHMIYTVCSGENPSLALWDFFQLSTQELRGEAENHSFAISIILPDQFPAQFRANYMYHKLETFWNKEQNPCNKLPFKVRFSASITGNKPDSKWFRMPNARIVFPPNLFAFEIHVFSCFHCN